METDVRNRTLFDFVPKVEAGKTIASRVSMNNRNAVRSFPITQELTSRLDRAAQLTGDNVTVVVNSGGQDLAGRRRLNSSPRHNIDDNGESPAADVFLMLDGKQVTPTNNRELYLQFAQNMAAEDPGLGFGHYKWGLHVDNLGGAWGPTKSSTSLGADFAQALDKGRSGFRTESAGSILKQELKPLKKRQDGVDEVTALDRVGTPRPTLDQLESNPVTTVNPVADQVNRDRGVNIHDRFSRIDLFEKEQGSTAIEGAPSFGQYLRDFGDTFFEGQSLVRLHDRLTSRPTQVDPSVTTNRILDELRKNNLSVERFAPQFSNVLNEEQLEERLSQVIEARDKEDRLGVGSTIASIASAILDPVPLVTEAATLGAAVPLTRGLQASRISRIAVNTGLGAGAVALGTTAENLVGDGEVNPNEVAISAAIGGALGGVVGALSRNPQLQREAAQIEAVKDRLDGTRHFRGSSAGAAQVQDPSRILSEDEAFNAIRDQDVSKAFAGNIRFSVIGRLKSSENPLARLAFGGLAKDGAGPSGPDDVQAFTPSEEASLLFEEFDTAYKRVHSNQLAAYMKRKAIKLSARSGAEADFNAKVADYIEDKASDAASKYDQEVVNVGNQLRKGFKELQQLAANPFNREGGTGRAVKGFDQFSDDPHYFTRIWNGPALSRFRDEYGDGVLARLIEKGIRKQVSDIEPQKAKKISTAFTKAIINRSLGFDDVGSKPISMDNLDDIIEVLRETGEISDEDIDALLKKFTSQGDAGRIGAARRRLLLNTDVELDVNEFVLPTGLRPDAPLRLKDLLIRDANYIYQRYTRQMAGRIGFAKYRVHDPKTGEIIVDGITSDAEFEQLIRRVDREGAERGVSLYKRTADKDRARFLYEQITGKAQVLKPNSLASKSLEALLKFNFVRIFNQVGFAQIPEIANVLHSTGLKAALSHMPAFRRAMNEMTGEQLLENGLARDLENFTFDGTDRIRNTVSQRFDDNTGEPISLREGGFFDRTLNTLDRASRITADISLLNGMNMALTRWTNKAIIQRFVDEAHLDGKSLNQHRLSQLGLSSTMAQRVFKELRNPDNVVTEKGALTGHKVVRFSPDNWTDREALEAFRRASFRFSRSIIQRGDIGMMMPWMSNPFARIIIQFRSFAIQAYENALLLNINRVANGDMSAFGWFFTSAMLAGLTRAVQVQISTTGRSDREAILEKELSAERLAAASFSRSGFSSLLPMIVDSGPSQVLFGAPTFDFRTTTEASDVIFGNPSGDLLNTFSRSIPEAALRPILEDREVSQQEIRAAMRGLPFSNFIPIQILLNSMVSDLPERASKN